MSSGQDQLQLFDVGVLLQALANDLKVGLLAVSSGGRRKWLHLDRGRLVCVYAREPRVTLQSVLYNQRTVSIDALREAADSLGPERTDAQLAEHLLERGAVTSTNLQRATTYQLLEEVLELFYWQNTGFEFHRGDARDVVHHATNGRYSIVGAPCAVDSLLIRCAKISDDIEKFNSVTPSLRDVYELHMGEVGEIEQLIPDPIEREFAWLLDGVRDMREVMRDMRMTRFDVMQLFHVFHTRGLLRRKNGFELLILAENRRAEFDHEKRARIYERISELGVEGFQVLMPLAEAYEQLGRRKDAAEVFLRHAETCVAADDLSTALASARRATQLVPQNARFRRYEIDLLEDAGMIEESVCALTKLAEIRVERGEIDKATRELRRAARLAGDDAGLWTRLGQVLSDRGRVARAAVALRRAGRLLLSRDDGIAAAVALEQAVKLLPTSWQLRFLEVDALMTAGCPDVGVSRLAALVSRVDRTPFDDPERRLAVLRRTEDLLVACGGMASPSARRLASVYRKLGAADDACRVLDRAAAALDDDGRPGEAMHCRAEIVELRPHDPVARLAHARSCVATGDRSEALAELARVASAHGGIDEWQAAAEAYAEMITLDRGSLAAHSGLALALHRAGETERALEQFRRAALLHRASGGGPDAQAFLDEALGLVPGDGFLLAEHCALLELAGAPRSERASALRRLADSRAADGDYAGAARAYADVVELDPDADDARERLVETATRLLESARALADAGA